MTNNIKFNLSNKISVNITFKNELSLLNVCELKNLVNANIPTSLFDFANLSDEDLIAYYENVSGLDYKDIAIKFGKEPFTLSDINYDYMRQGNMLQVSGTLTYKSHTDFFGGNGKFLIDFYVVFILPEDNTGQLEVYSCLLTITADDNKTWTKAFNSLIDKVSLTSLGEDDVYITLNNADSGDDNLCFE